jgi:hypothetical protein
MSDVIVPRPTGLEYLPQTIAAYEAAVGNLFRRDAHKVMGRLPHILGTEEPVITFCQAVRRDSVKQNVVLALTPTQLLVIDENTSSVVERHRPSDCWVREWRTDLMWGYRLTLVTPSGERSFRRPLPVDEGLRIAVAFGHPDPWKRELLGDLPAEPVGPPIACCWKLTLFPDRLVDHELRHLPFTGEVEATVDSAGNIAVTRGRNLAAKGAGTLLFGPFGLLLAGNAKHRHIDTRELYLLVEGPGWAYTQQFVPDMGQALRQFASTLNVTARRYWEERSAASDQKGATTDGAGKVEQLAKLAELHTNGALTDDEFAAAKAQLLGL